MAKSDGEGDDRDERLRKRIEIVNSLWQGLSELFPIGDSVPGNGIYLKFRGSLPEDVAKEYGFEQLVDGSQSLVEIVVENIEHSELLVSDDVLLVLGEAISLAETISLSWPHLILRDKSVTLVFDFFDGADACFEQLYAYIEAARTMVLIRNYSKTIQEILNDIRQSYKLGVAHYDIGYVEVGDGEKRLKISQRKPDVIPEMDEPVQAELIFPFEKLDDRDALTAILMDWLLRGGGSYSAVGAMNCTPTLSLDDFMPPEPCWRSVFSSFSR